MVLDPNLELQGARRLRWLARLAVVWALVIFVRLIQLQVIDHRRLLDYGHRQAHDTVEIPALRGRILDRSGQTLAISVAADTIVVNPRIAPDLSLARDIFVPILGLDPEELRARMDWAVRHNRGYLPIKQKVTPEESRKILSLNLDWVELHRDSRRRYPKGALAANLIGSVNFRGQGNAGLELSLNRELTGTSGVATILRDARGRAIQTEILQEPTPGADIGISIDERIQFAADQALAQAAREWNCETGSLVAMDPHTGDILAMSSFPTFEPESGVKTIRDLAARVNLAISTPFEPGSVFKIITLSAALETTDLRPESMIACGPGVLSLHGRRITDIHAYGTIPLEKVLWKSSNIGAIQAALRVGDRRLLDYVRRFGFGEKTGIALPAESPGRVRRLTEWSRTSIGSVAMGHEISATSLQLARAASVIANGGLLVRPRVVLWSQRPGAARADMPIEPGTRVLRPETAITMRRMMEGVVLHGTGTRARLTGYSAGGKTGSAQIFDFETRRYSHRYNSSFVGFAPVTDPRIVVAVTLNGASRYGGVVSAPVFRTVAQTALRILGVVPDVVDPRALPDAAEEEFADLAVAGLGEGPASPASGPGFETARLEAGDGDTPADGEASSPYLFGPRVPSLQGKTLRAVLEETSRMGMLVEYVGSGVARAQYPAAGAVLPVGQKVLVEFAR